MTEPLSKHWPEDDPLLPLRNWSWDILPEQDRFAFTIAYAAYQRKFKHVQVICGEFDSLVTRAERLLQHWSASPGEETQSIVLVPFNEIGLESENLLIHLNMLMDRISQLIVFWYPRKQRDEIPYRSFDAHRKFFLKDRGARVDHEYCQFIRQNTEWFIPLLKNPRDDLVVHFPKAESIHLGGDVRIDLLGTTQKSRIFHLLKEHAPQEWADLVEEFQQKDGFIPDGGPVQGAIKVLEGVDSLSEGDKETVKKARQHVGGSLPDLTRLLDSVWSYLTFIKEHFASRLPLLGI